MDNIHDDASKMQNRAGDARSPFIRSFKNSQVLWQELDTDAISRAKEENKLIFLHIGYKACHRTLYPLPSCDVALPEADFSRLPSHGNGILLQL